MAAIPRRFLRHRIIVEPYLGTTGTGDSYGPPVEMRCFLDQKTRNVRTPAGDTVVSSSTAYASPGTSAPPLSRVTLPGGRQTKVIQDAPRDSGGLGAPDHVEIQLE
ncbi:hypothetical protein GCM10011583_12000 [Streptomyces camponoticapitis]|uniref:Uncharacterized protein n=1 Tax=Streptomyces camponoticapitis TaxID=1616125 RepID=A0ABQ2E432_9ACTN|nr:hypothetical protein [Streptomyces camponoticapitis]GGJ82052.1 hypothetical protein GCM10011583_12000 [Streptomyces camponoticapitis]